MRKILATLALILFPALAWAQAVAPPGTAALVCAYNTSPPALTSGLFAYVQCDANGKIITSGGGGGGGSGTVTSVGETFTGGLISVAGSPVTVSGTFALTVAGTSGGIPYFSGATTWASSAALAANALVIGGGAGAAPASTTTGTGVVTALGVNVGSAGAVVVNGGALGTPSSGTLTNATGLPIAGITGLGTGVGTALAIAVNTTGGPATYPVSGAGLTLTVGSTTTSGGGAGQLMFDSGPGTFQEATGLLATNTTLTVSGGSLILSGNQSAAAWTTNGLRLKGVAGTLTDTSSSGTVAAQYTDVLGGNTIAASSATTYTKYASLHLNAPVAGTNVTFTSNPALDIAGANNSYAATIAGGSATGSGTNGVGLNITGTLNTSGVVAGAAIFANITNTASGAGAKIVDIQSSSVSVFSVNFPNSVTQSKGIMFVNDDGDSSATRAAVISGGTGLFVQNSVANDTGFLLRVISGTPTIAASFGSTGAYQPLNIFTNGSSRFQFTNGGNFNIGGGALSFGASVGTESSFISSPGSANIHLGAADAAAPVAQTLGVQSVVAGTTNTAGSAWTLTGSLSTGSGTSGDIILKTGNTGAGATAQNAATTALTIKGATQNVIAAANLDAATYTVGGAAGVSCTLTAVAHLTVVNGIVTLCN